MTTSLEHALAVAETRRAEDFVLATLRDLENCAKHHPSLTLAELADGDEVLDAAIAALRDAEVAEAEAWR